MSSLNGTNHMRPRKMAFGERCLAVLAAALLIAGCAAGPQYPLYSPLAVAGSFGFTEQRVNDTTYRITYLAPRRTAYSPNASVEPYRTALLNLATDMALMRAAELAQTNGYQSFRVSQRDNDMDVNRERYDGWCEDPFWPRRPYHYPRTYRCGPDGYTYFRARSTQTVEFGHRPGDEHYIVQDVLARLQQTYPTARAAGSAKQ